MRKTPTSILVMSILGIIFGAFTLIMLPVALYLTFVLLAHQPPIEELLKDQGYVAYSLISSVMSFLFAAWLIVASIASLKLKRWGRTGMLAYAWTQGIQVLVMNTITVLYVDPKIEAIVGAAATPSQRTITVVQAIVGVLISWTFCGLLIHFFNRTIAVNAFNGVFDADPTNFPVEFQDQPPQDQLPPDPPISPA